MNLWSVENFSAIFVITFGWVQQQTHWGQQQTHPQVMTKMLKKVFNWSEVHLSEVTFYKIHTLIDFSKKLEMIQSANILLFKNLNADPIWG